MSILHQIIGYIQLLGSGLGLDSLDALEVVLCVENAFQVKILDQNIAVLRSIKTLKNINGLPAAEFWKRVDAGESPQAK